MSDHVGLLAAAATRSSRAWGLGLATASQLGWGLYPVFARALLTQEPALSLLELTVALNVRPCSHCSLVLLHARVTVLVHAICRAI